MTRVAICQSNYLPWKGYFDLIHDVDVFVFYDDVQYTKNDWRNRNKIKTPQGVQWLTIPVGSHCHCRICDVSLQDSYWQKQHWKTLVQRYRKAP
ncbi:MAG TPA: WbqC family protein, partial [Nitrospira sp.]|nr:WbqC family protein [Nitrospira sp.]